MAISRISETSLEPLTFLVNSKTLADVTESIVAAALLEDKRCDEGEERSTAMLKLIFLKIEWLSSVRAAGQVRERYHADSGPLVDLVAQILGYKFHRSAILREALTHSSCQPGVQSFDRLDFLGDAILDWMIKARLSEHSELTPGSMTILRHAVASHSYLACCGLVAVTTRKIQDTVPCGRDFISEERSESVFLTDLITFHDTNPGMLINAARSKLEGVKIEIEEALDEGVFPWTLLRSLNAPKVCSDIVESLIAAVYIDSAGSLDHCEDIVKNLGIMAMIDKMVQRGGFDSRTPATILREYCDTIRKNADITVIRGPDIRVYVG